MTSSGQIKAKPTTVSKEMESLIEEQDQRLVCCICREGYKFYPNKVILCPYKVTFYTYKGNPLL